MLKDMREARNMTQEDLGKLVDVDRSQVARWESGQTRPWSKTMRRLCEVFQCTEKELFGSAD